MHDTGKDFIESLSIQGWKFIPTWVGPQAACTNYIIAPMSYNPTTAYNQGRDNGTDAPSVPPENWDSQKTDDSGTVIYYDLEAFNIDNTLA